MHVLHVHVHAHVGLADTVKLLYMLYIGFYVSESPVFNVADIDL